MLPPSLQSYIEQELGSKIISTQSVSGGSINQAAKIEVKNVGHCFLKWNTSTNPDMFNKEAKGLKLLSSAETNLIIPEVIIKGKTVDNIGFLLLEFLPEERRTANAPRSFGENLARLHKHTAEKFGLDHDNYIGRLHQSNTRHKSWSDFFIEERIMPQLKMGADSGYFSSQDRQAFQNLFRQIPDIFPGEPPSLLHGDLWSGNYFYTDSGKAAIFDPAVYYGSREIELSFTRLFGGFSAGFYEAYDQSHPLEAGFDNRIDIYNLYPLLVHTNLFGSSYASQVKSIVKKFR
ncbi:MAG: fructosamine kinase family protein [Balneolaceae bacterium]|nr:fructosamine kinase family protein [Balneolaceae bacterium]